MTLIADASLELWNPNSGYAFDIQVGGLDDVPVVRGDNVVIPGKDGQTWMPKVADHFPVVLRGIVMGEAGAKTARASYLDRITALKAIFDPTEEPFTLTITSPLEGLESGESYTITVEFLRFTVIDEGAHYRYMDIECQAIGDPPAWAATGGS